jgi:hypothetical protein
MKKYEPVFSAVKRSFMPENWQTQLKTIKINIQNGKRRKRGLALFLLFSPEPAEGLTLS